MSFFSEVCEGAESRRIAASRSRKRGRPTDRGDGTLRSLTRSAEGGSGYDDENDGEVRYRSIEAVGSFGQPEESLDRAQPPQLLVVENSLPRRVSADSSTG